MATVNAQAPDYDDDEGLEGSGAFAPSKELGWRWQTWPSNLRRAAAISLGTLVTVVAITMLLDAQDQEFTEKLESSNSKKSQSLTKLRDSGQERDTIVKNLPLLRELEERGIFGEEKRLEWVEQLRIIEKRWPGIAIKYDITPQKLVPKEGTNGVVPPIPVGAKLPNGDPVKQFGVFSTDMKLALQLLHEGDALALFEELKAAKLGMFIVKKCTLQRPSNGSQNDTPSSLGAPLTVDCLLNWTSMNAYAP